jgi:hypothetical protein
MIAIKQTQVLVYYKNEYNANLTCVEGGVQKLHKNGLHFPQK